MGKYLPKSAILFILFACGILDDTTGKQRKAETATLDAIGAEMQVLYQLLSGSYSPEDRSAKMKGTILEVNQGEQFPSGR